MAYLEQNYTQAGCEGVFGLCAGIQAGGEGTDEAELTCRESLGEEMRKINRHFLFLS